MLEDIQKQLRLLRTMMKSPVDGEMKEEPDVAAPLETSAGRKANIGNALQAASSSPDRDSSAPVPETSRE
jgi:hypothetical protein